jgi:lipooligosaccharide transport system permease protein
MWPRFWTPWRKSSFVVIPMFLFSGTFFPVSQLPSWLQPVAFATPIYHGVEMSRAIITGVAPAVAPWISIAYLLAWTVLGTVLAIRPFRKRLTP